MRKLRAGLDREIAYFDREKYIRRVFFIKVETKLIDKETNKEIIFFDYENELNFRCKIPKGLEKINFKDFGEFYKKEDNEKYLYYKNLYINDFVKILIKDNSAKVELNKELLKQFPFRIKYDIKYEISYSYLKKGIIEYRTKTQEEFFKELNDLEKNSDEEIRNNIREQRKDSSELFYSYRNIEIQ